MNKIICLIALGLLVGCGKIDPDSPKMPRLVKNTSIVLPKINALVKMGEQVAFEVTAEGETVDSVTIIAGEFSKTFKQATFNWTPTTKRTGSFSFQVKIYSNGEEETHYPKLKILSDVEPEQFGYVVLGAYQHDSKAYTQGLFFLDGDLIESTGQEGESTIRRVNPNSGVVLKTAPLAEQYFGEGSTFYKNEIYQLTWTSRVGFVYDKNLNQRRTFQYNTDGWGLTTKGDSLVMTDGSEKMYFINPVGFTEIGNIEVYDHKGPIKNLNELEYINGCIYANEYQTNKIHVIEPATGRVLKQIDLSGLLTSAEASKADVLNGIAYDAKGDRLFVTGKWWPWLFEIKLQPKNSQL